MDLAAAVNARFLAVNGEHPMTAADDAYVDEWFTPLEELPAPADELRRLMLANRLPLPGYLRSDGAQMVPRDLLELIHRAGGPDQLPTWFASHFPNVTTAVEEWDAYLAGHYVCLRSVTPENIVRKSEVVAAIEALLADRQATSEEWLEELHRLVDQLDALEPPFAPYDRLRFGGPVSRDLLVDEPRMRFPRHGALQIRAQTAHNPRRRGPCKRAETNECQRWGMHCDQPGERRQTHAATPTAG